MENQLLDQKRVTQTTQANVNKERKDLEKARKQIESVRIELAELGGRRLDLERQLHSVCFVGCMYVAVMLTFLQCCDRCMSLLLCNVCYMCTWCGLCVVRCKGSCRTQTRGMWRRRLSGRWSWRVSGDSTNTSLETVGTPAKPKLSRSALILNIQDTL